jgi:hypothetical protein
MRKAIIAVDSAFARAVLANVQNTAGRPPTVINPKAAATGAKTGAINSITISESLRSLLDLIAEVRGVRCAMPRC